MTGQTTEAPELHWIPPCRKRLEREADYPFQTREATQ